MNPQKSIHHHASMLRKMPSSPGKPIDLILATTIIESENPNATPETLLRPGTSLPIAISALYHTMPQDPPTSEHAQYTGCPDNPHDLPELRQLAQQINESGDSQPSDLTVSYVRSLSKLIPPHTALLWAQEADKYLHTVTDTRRAFGKIDLDHGPEHITQCAAEAAAFATVQFYRHHGHLPQHHAIAATVAIALNNPDPDYYSPVPPTHENEEDLPF